MKRRYLYLIIIILIILCWQLLSSQYNTVKLFISSPSAVAVFFVSEFNSLISASAITFIEALLGLIFASVFSFLAMMVCFYKPSLINFLLPIMILSQVIPLIILAPLFIILLGFGIYSKIAMASLISFFPIYVNFAAGYKSIPMSILDYLSINNAKTTFKIFNVYFPLSLRNIIAGLKISATLSVIGAIVAEFSGTYLGLGKNLFLSTKHIAPELMINSLIMASIIGSILFGSICMIEYIFGKWYLGKNTI